jgi:hypothetical protein
VALPEGALRQGHHADPDSGNAQAGRELGFRLTRKVAHAETAVDDWSSQRQRTVEYEMRLNDVVPNYEDPVICTYDVNLLNANFAVDIPRTHPVVIIGGVLVENSFLSRPEELLRELRGRTAASQSYRG